MTQAAQDLPATQVMGMLPATPDEPSLLQVAAQLEVQPGIYPELVDETVVQAASKECGIPILLLGAAPEHNCIGVELFVGGSPPCLQLLDCLEACTHR